MLMQWPARIAPAQKIPQSSLVSSLDIVPTVLHAAGMPYKAVRNAGGALDGKSWLGLVKTTGSKPSDTPSAAVGGTGGEGVEGWRDSLWFEIGQAGGVKHRSSWQLVVVHYTDTIYLRTPTLNGPAKEVLSCSRERLRTGGRVWSINSRAFTHTTHCVVKATGEALTSNLVGELHVKLDSDLRYPRFHQARVKRRPTPLPSHLSFLLPVSLPCIPLFPSLRVAHMHACSRRSNCFIRTATT